MTGFAYELAPSRAPRLGLIVLNVDETIEQDFRRLIPPAAADLHVTRVQSGQALTTEAIAGMERALPDAAGLLPGSTIYDVVAYACTSGAAMIGPDRVKALISERVEARTVTDPLTAACAGLAARAVHRLGIVSPYRAEVGAPLERAFRARGFDVVNTLSFGEEIESRVARIAPASIAGAARHLHLTSELDGLFISCTNLRTLDLIAPLEDELGIPVLSSNTALAAHIGALAGIDGIAGTPCK